MAVEERPFTIEAKAEEYEIRKYGSNLVAETTIAASFREAGKRGFRILADYLFGNNRSMTKLATPKFNTRWTRPERVAMTAPVTQMRSPWGFLVQFSMPTSYSLATLPRPNDARIHLREISPRRIAAISYSGSWSEAHFHLKRNELVAALKRDGVHTTGEPVFARFNSPFQLWFLRRNEIWIEVTP